MESTIFHKQSNELYCYSETVQISVLTYHTVISSCNDYIVSLIVALIMPQSNTVFVHYAAKRFLFYFPDPRSVST